MSSSLGSAPSPSHKSKPRFAMMDLLMVLLPSAAPKMQVLTSTKSNKGNSAQKRVRTTSSAVATRINTLRADTAYMAHGSPNWSTFIVVVTVTGVVELVITWNEDRAANASSMAAVSDTPTASRAVSL